MGELNLGDFANHEIDAFGDTYEYLMQMYASEAGSPAASTTHPRKSPNCWHASPSLARPK